TWFRGGSGPAGTRTGRAGSRSPCTPSCCSSSSTRPWCSSIGRCDGRGLHCLSGWRDGGLCNAASGLAPPAECAVAAGHDDLAVQHALDGEQLVTQVAHLGRLAAQYRHLQAVTLAKVDVQAGDDEVMVVVLLVDQPAGQVVRV